MGGVRTVRQAHSVVNWGRLNLVSTPRHGTRPWTGPGSSSFDGRSAAHLGEVARAARHAALCTAGVRGLGRVPFRQGARIRTAKSSGNLPRSGRSLGESVRTFVSRLVRKRWCDRMPCPIATSETIRIGAPRLPNGAIVTRHAGGNARCVAREIGKSRPRRHDRNQTNPRSHRRRRMRRDREAAKARHRRRLPHRHGKELTCIL